MRAPAQRAAPEIDHQALPDRAPRQSRARAPASDRQTGLHSGVNEHAGLADAAGKGHGDRLELIDRGVGRVKLAREIVERDLAICGPKSRLVGSMSSRAIKISAA
jgi:hypothetical protein